MATANAAPVFLAPPLIIPSCLSGAVRVLCVLLIFRYASSKDAPAAQRAYEELKADGLIENETTLSNLVVALSWGNFKTMKR